jgi:hypothetical protein
MGYGTGPAATEAHARADVQRLERLVVRAFGTRADIAALDGPDDEPDDPAGA